MKVDNPTLRASQQYMKRKQRAQDQRNTPDLDRSDRKYRRRIQAIEGVTNLFGVWPLISGVAFAGLLATEGCNEHNTVDTTAMLHKPAQTILDQSPSPSVQKQVAEDPQ